MKKPKKPVKATEGRHTEEKGSHTGDFSTVALLVVGTERSLRENGPARKRAQWYASILDRYDALVYGVGRSGESTPLGMNGSVIDALEPNMFRSFLTAYEKGCAAIAAHPGKHWVVSAQDPFESGLLAYAIARKTGAGLHLQLHTDPDARAWTVSKKNRVRALIYRFLAPRADAIRVVSARAERSVLSRGAQADRVVVVPIVSDDEVTAEPSVDIRAGYKDAGEIILGMGRLSHEKGFDLLIEAMRPISSARPSAILLLVGSGPEEHALKRRVERLGLSARVRFVPWVRDVAAYLRAADVVVMPSRFEGWGLVACEAARHGKAVVMTDTGCAGEVIRDGESGVVVPPEDTDALSRAVIKTLSDPSFRAHIEEGARRSAKMLVTNDEALRLHKESWETAYRHAASRQKKD